MPGWLALVSFAALTFVVVVAYNYLNAHDADSRRRGPRAPRHP
ncbi:MAG TPA: hypothetical protein VLJ76_09085 [Gaiellaceae bacterium]|nr:hypothetical protein [Gaiellaceae bacterium]